LGTTFSFTLPLPLISNPGLYPPLDNSTLTGRRLLVVEDNNTSRSILQNYALSWGMSVETTENALSALDLLQIPTDSLPNYDLVVIDKKITGMDGLELGRQIKADPKFAHIPVILTTSTLALGDTVKAKKSLFATILTKPIRKADLHRCFLLAFDRLISDTAEEAFASTSTRLNLHILLAEDNVVNQAVAEAMLQSFGCSVDIVQNGSEALQAVELKTYDLVLMDCMMPVMDGYEATAEIRQRQNAGQLAYFPIIALTANAIEGDHDKCLAAGMDDYLSKPFKGDSLLHIVTSWTKHPKMPIDAN